MLFGLGAKLRKVGFLTEMIGDRDKLIKFCEDNPDFTALSTGKAYKQVIFSFKIILIKLLKFF